MLLRRADAAAVSLMMIVCRCSMALGAEGATPTPGSLGVAAPATYFMGHAEGWFWYRDSADEMLSEAPVPPIPVEPPVSKEDPVAAVESQRKALEVALDRAVLQPTTENMRTYLELNSRLLAQSAAFANAWKGVLYTNPDLDYRQISPIGPAVNVRADLDRDDAERRLRAAASEWGLVFFFRGTCAYCHQMAPLVGRFADRYGFRIVDVTLDGGTLPLFPHPQINAEAGTALGVDAVPAVFLINPRTREIVPAAYGLLGWSELAERVLYAVDRAASGKGGVPSDVAVLGAGR